MITTINMLYDLKEPIPDEIINMIDSFISSIIYISISFAFLLLISLLFRR